MPSFEAKIVEILRQMNDTMRNIDKRLTLIEFRQRASESGRLTDEEIAEAAKVLLRRKPARTAAEIALEKCERDEQREAVAGDRSAKIN